MSTIRKIYVQNYGDSLLVVNRLKLAFYTHWYNRSLKKLIIDEEKMFVIAKLLADFIQDSHDFISNHVGCFVC